MVSKSTIRSLLSPGNKVDSTDPKYYKRKWVIFALVTIGFLMDNLNVSGGLSMQDSIIKHFDIDSTTASWVVSAYALTYGTFIIFFGKVADIVGIHKVYLGGLVIILFFTLLAATITTSIEALIVFRALQGVGAAALVPTSYAFIPNYFQGKDINIAIVLFSCAAVSSFGVGLVIAGALTYVNFLWVNFSVCTAIFILLYILVIPVPVTKGHKALSMKNINYASLVLMVAGLLLIILGFTEAATTWRSSKVYVPLPVGVVLLVVVLSFDLIYIPRYRKKHPGLNNWRSTVDLFFPVEVFRIKNALPILGSLGFLYVFMFAMYIVLLQYYGAVHGDSALMSAVKLLPHTVGLSIASVTSEQLIDRMSERVSFISTASIILICSAWMSQIHYTVKNDYWIFNFAPLFISGYATNVFFKCYMRAILPRTPLHLQALVTGIFQTALQVGVGISTAVTATILGVVVRAHTDQEKHDVWRRARNGLFFALASSAVLFFIIVIFIRTVKPEAQADAEPEPDLEAGEKVLKEETKQTSLKQESVKETSRSSITS